MDINYEELFSKTKYAPRPYQLRIVRKVITEFEHLNNILIEAPCGSGKTCMGLILAKYYQDTMGYNIGWISHRRNLLSQVSEENVTMNVGLKFSAISMFDKDPPKNIQLVVTDECHHDACDSMQHIYNDIKPVRVIGLSATAYRSDRLKLCFQKIIKDAGIGALIRDKYLAQYNHWTIPNYDVDTVIDFYIKNIKLWGKTAMYFHRIEQCDRAKNLLRMHNINSEVVRGDNDAEATIDRFRYGQFNVIINCLKLTEGFNEPSLNTCFCKPSSKGVTIQMAGRAFRPYQNTIKNIVQAETTPYVFTKVANPVNTYAWSKERSSWLGLKPNKNTGVAQKNSLKALASIEVKLPKIIIKARPKPRRFLLRS